MPIDDQFRHELSRSVLIKLIVTTLSIVNIVTAHNTIYMITEF